MANRWGPEGPPPEAYSRVSNQERFDPLAGVVDTIVADLVATYDVTVEHPADGGVRLVPAVGSPLTLDVDLPVVYIARGTWGSGCIPPCTCDACDEDAESAADMLREFVEETVAGEFTETLSRHPRRLATTGRNSGGWTMLDRAQYDALATVAPPGTRRWDPWPRRRG